MVLTDATCGMPANWTSMGLSLMHQFTFPMNVQVLDQMQVLRAGNSGQVLFQDETIRRAAKLGENIAQAMHLPASEQRWMGDEEGTCPVCHSGLMVVGKTATIECAVCGIQGTLKIENDVVDVTFTREEQAKSRLTLEGKRIHFREIGEVTGEFMAVKSQLPAKIEKYRSYPLKVAKPAREHLTKLENAAIAK